jgi:hypothetical protein
MANKASIINLNIADNHQNNHAKPITILKLMQLLDIDQITGDHFTSALPFSKGDATAGSESELQATVIGEQEYVDLPQVILESNYFKNIIRKTKTGDASPKVLTDLKAHLDSNSNLDGSWENSWVRFPLGKLNTYANEIFHRDLLADKKNPAKGMRGDHQRFFFIHKGETHVRLPISYLLKLSLADIIGSPQCPPQIRVIGEGLLDHFLNDNSSPETISFYIAEATDGGTLGRNASGECLIRFLLSQMLVQYANRKFGLLEAGQQAVVYFAPHPPIRQKALNEIIPDSFYRELFMSPCLSGWQCGEDKNAYMALCHQVLSRGQLNAVTKLKEAGIITNNLIVMPNTSNISLANNGTHISLGSRKLTALLADSDSGFTAVDEKYYGDLAIKIIEHFLPLFVGTYSGAPYRLDFKDFHPEKVLGFLPHELDFTHLRMIWRRWKNKAHLKFLGQPITPFGPPWLDRLIARCLRLKGDFICDFRLVDYLVALLGTLQNSALDGRSDGVVALKRDLAELGIFHEAMPLYLIYRLRRFDQMGFSGFEGRHYSLFERIGKDMGMGADLQVLLSALAYKYILKGQITHRDIPDNPTVESERRQIFFGSAIGIPTFFVDAKTENRLLHRIITRTHRTRNSHRYRGYIRVHNHEYRQALLRTLKDDAQDLIEMMDLTETIADLGRRIDDYETCSAAGRITKNICRKARVQSPMDLRGHEFNLAAEKYYRNTLKKRHMQEAFAFIAEGIAELDSWTTWRKGVYNHSLMMLLDGKSATIFMERIQAEALAENLRCADLVKAIGLLLLLVDSNKNKGKKRA